MEKQELVNKGQLISPRMACKLFYDALYIIEKAEQNPKFIKDRIPEVAHKFFKKKQWRKQFYEGMRRVCCRLAIGLGFRPNCIAEDAFIHAILSIGFELGYNRIKEHIDPLPEWEGKDRDFSKVLKFGANEEVANLLNKTDPSKTSVDPSKNGKKKDDKMTQKVDVKTGWFKCYDTSAAHVFDHIVLLSDEEIDGWSVSTDSSVSQGRSRSDSVRSDITTESDVSESSSGISRARSGSNPLLPSRGGKVMTNLEQLDEKQAYFAGEFGSNTDLASLSSLSFKPKVDVEKQ